ncbi:hypothetical protein C7B82_19735 [Stenomitos frigidus ULC18]|uniref:Uncharacterized protein n=1 Tax=Stenomitos frigidus ULC18 TaxID=2107698 RepID=A0A2T1E187_9CYAN|nr:hypothetical protein C7B82_19735 [Stenomitos frigidus ULC18]
MKQFSHVQASWRFPVGNLFQSYVSGWSSGTPGGFYDSALLASTLHFLHAQLLIRALKIYEAV